MKHMEPKLKKERSQNCHPADNGGDVTFFHVRGHNRHSRAFAFELFHHTNESVGHMHAGKGVRIHVKHVSDQDLDRNG